jgi:pimeloyl-ACP methyl ester carboxylesterase
VLPRKAVRAATTVLGPYDHVEIASAGHFPHEETPAAFTEALLKWLGSAASRGDAGR